MMARDTGGAVDLANMENGGGVRRQDDGICGERGWDDDESDGGRGEGGGGCYEEAI